MQGTAKGAAPAKSPRDAAGASKESYVASDLFCLCVLSLMALGTDCFFALEQLGRIRLPPAAGRSRGLLCVQASLVFDVGCHQLVPWG